MRKDGPGPGDPVLSPAMSIVQVVRTRLSPLIWLCAFICALYPVNKFQLYFMMVATILSLVWSYERLSRALKAGLIIPHQPLILIMTLFWLLMLFNVSWSSVPWISILAGFFLGALPLTFLTLSVSPYTRQEWETIAAGLAGILSVMAAWALIQFFVFSDYFFGRARHPLADPNSLAAIFNLAIISALGAMTYVTQRNHKALALGFALLFMGGSMATGSRGAFFALLMGMVLCGAFCWRFVWQSRRWWGGFLAGAVLIFCLSLEGKNQYANLAQRVGGSVGIGEGPIYDNRLDTMKAALQVVREHWLLGTGTGTFYLFYPEHRPLHEIDLVTQAHNDPLQFWVEMGILAPVLFYVFLIFAAFATWRRAGMLDKDDRQRVGLLFPFVALAVLIAHSHINFNLYNLSILFLCGVLLAFWYAQLHWQGNHTTLRYSWVKQSVLALVFAGALSVYTPMMLSEHYLMRARDAIFASDLDGYGVNLMRADLFGLQRNHGVYSMAVSLPLSLLYQRAHLFTAEEQRKEAEQINNNLNMILALNPRSASAWYYKGKLVQVLKPGAVPEDMPTPQQAFEKALALDPLHFGARIALISLALEKNDIARARELTHTAMRYRIHSAIARDFFTKAIVVYTLSNDPVMVEQAKIGMQEYNALEKQSILRKKSPWQWLRDGGDEAQTESFPQAVDSKGE